MSVKPWEASGIPRAPARFRSSSEEDELGRPAHSRHPATPSLAGIPRYPKTSNASGSPAGSRTGSSQSLVQAHRA
ncbi:hypothetical protein OEZ86_005873 [Tetradesmus obliquus]|nr:hypothetical protein OEZ86_005873 [Tetradesmus obliquus]